MANRTLPRVAVLLCAGLSIGLMPGCAPAPEAEPEAPPQPSEPQPPQPDPQVQALVARLDLDRYKATIRGLTQFGDRRHGT